MGVLQSAAAAGIITGACTALSSKLADTQKLSVGVFFSFFVQHPIILLAGLKETGIAYAVTVVLTVIAAVVLSFVSTSIDDDNIKVWEIFCLMSSIFFFFSAIPFYFYCSTIGPADILLQNPRSLNSLSSDYNYIHNNLGQISLDNGLITRQQRIDNKILNDNHKDLLELIFDDRERKNNADINIKKNNIMFRNKEKNVTSPYKISKLDSYLKLQDIRHVEKVNNVIDSVNIENNDFDKYQTLSKSNNAISNTKFSLYLYLRPVVQSLHIGNYMNNKEGYSNFYRNISTNLSTIMKNSLNIISNIKESTNSKYSFLDSTLKTKNIDTEQSLYTSTTVEISSFVRELGSDTLLNCVALTASLVSFGFRICLATYIWGGCCLCLSFICLYIVLINRFLLSHIYSYYCRQLYHGNITKLPFPTDNELEFIRKYIQFAEVPDHLKHLDKSPKKNVNKNETEMGYSPVTIGKTNIPNIPQQLPVLAVHTNTQIGHNERLVTSPFIRNGNMGSGQIHQVGNTQVHRIQNNPAVLIQSKQHRQLSPITNLNQQSVYMNTANHQQYKLVPNPLITNQLGPNINSIGQYVNTHRNNISPNAGSKHRTSRNNSSRRSRHSSKSKKTRNKSSSIDRSRKHDSKSSFSKSSEKSRYNPYASEEPLRVTHSLITSSVMESGLTAPPSLPPPEQGAYYAEDKLPSHCKIQFKSK